MDSRLALLSASLADRAARFSLTDGTLIVGRSSKCELVVNDDTVSRRHAEILVTRPTLIVRDLGSRNGTFIDGQCVRTGTLRLGQRVQFGSVPFLLIGDTNGQCDVDSEVETPPLAPHPLDHVLRDLSKAQRRVVALILEGLVGEKEIAAHLCLSPSTVHNHLQSIYRAFQVHSRSELILHVLGRNAKSSDGTR
jgi:DNA-binding CsgD family transcriptional regulator